MSRATADKVLATLFATALGIAGALLLAHWAACEQDDTVCLITGEPS